MEYQISLFDDGDVFSRLKDMKVLNENIKAITVFITHLHPDHIGSLGDLIYYCYFKTKLREKIKVISLDTGIVTLLSLIGVPKDYYNSHIIESDKTQVFLDSSC